MKQALISLAIISLLGCAVDLNNPTVQQQLQQIEQAAINAAIDFLNGYIQSHTGIVKTYQLTNSKAFVKAEDAKKAELIALMQAKYPTIDKQVVVNTVDAGFNKGLIRETTR